MRNSEIVKIRPEIQDRELLARLDEEFKKNGEQIKVLVLENQQLKYEMEIADLPLQDAKGEPNPVLENLKMKLEQTLQKLQALRGPGEDQAPVKKKPTVSCEPDFATG